MLDGFQVKNQHLQGAVQQLTSSLAEKEELLEELQQAMQEKLGVGGKGERGGIAGEGEVNPVVRYKEAILRLQSEIKEMFVASNFLNMQLLQCRQRQQNSRLEKMQKHRKRRARRFKGKGGTGTGNGHGSSIEEDDN